MKTFAAGSDVGAPSDPDSREWVFGLIASPRHRRRMQQLEQVDLRRRPGCEPCLRSLVTGDWTQETLFHVGWCDSCGGAAVALDSAEASGEAGSAWYGQRATWLALAALAVVAVPLVGSQVIGSDAGTGAERGGAASAVGDAGATATAGTSSASGSSSSPATAGATVTPVARSKSSRSAAQLVPSAQTAQHAGEALPLTP